MNESLKVALFLGFLRFCSKLPLPINHALGAFLGFIYVLFPSRDRHVVWVNLSIAFPEQSHWQRMGVLIGFFKELGKTLTELGIIWLSEPARLLLLIKEIAGQSYMDEALTKGKGVMLLTPHFGAWEVIGPYWSHQMPMTILYQPPEQADLAPFVQQARERMGATLVPTDISGVRALLSALKKNQLAGILPDQDPGENGGVFAPFFGKLAHTMVLAGRLANKSDASVLFTICERLPWGKGYRMHLLPCDDAVHDKDPLISATAMNHSLQACVLVAPTQYIWNYKRWRQQPDGIDLYHINITKNNKDRSK
jgi:KDO2-lipid IV(A) lauroyltransferase